MERTGKIRDDVTRWIQRFSLEWILPSNTFPLCNYIYCMKEGGLYNNHNNNHDIEKKSVLVLPHLWWQQHWRLLFSFVQKRNRSEYLTFNKATPPPTVWTKDKNCFAVAENSSFECGGSSTAPQHHFLRHKERKKETQDVSHVHEEKKKAPRLIRLKGLVRCKINRHSCARR